MSKCPACTDEFSEEFKIPKVLPCGHTYCLICIFAIFQAQKAFVCKECMQAVRDPNVIKNLPNNYAILKCIQQFKSQKSSMFSPQTFFSQSTSNPFNDFPENTTAFSSPSFDHFRRHSPTHAGPANDSFNFDGFKSFLNDTRDKALMRSFTEPRKARSKTPPRRFNDIEFHDRGVFREKTPPGKGMDFFQGFPQQSQQFQQFTPMPDLCNIRSCNNPKMYLKGSLQQFCPQHYAEFNQQSFGNQAPNAMMFEPQGFPQGPQSGFGGGMNFGMSNSGSSQFSQFSLGSQQYHSSSHENSSSLNTSKSSHKFGKPSALELMKFYEKSPSTSKTSLNNSSVHNKSNSSVFASFGPKDNQSMDFGKISIKNTPGQMPFPEIGEIFTKEQKQASVDKCIIPNCGNQRMVYKGMTYPVCGRKCFQKWQSLPRENPFWT